MRNLLYLALLAVLLPAPALAQSSPERLAQATAARAAGDQAEAIRVYRTLVADADPSVRALALEGAALLLSWQGEFDESVKYYRELARLSPDKRREATMSAARVLGWGRHYAPALRELDPLIDATPDDIALRMLEGEIAGWGGYTDRAVAALEHVLALDPDHRDAHLTLAKVLSWGSRLAEAETAFADLLAKHPGYDQALVGMTYTLLWQGRPHAAERYFDRISDPGFRAGREYRIVHSALEWGLGDRTEAVHERKHLVREFPGEPDVRDLWRAQTGVVGHNLRGNGQFFSDNEGLEVWSVGDGGAFDFSDPAFVFAEGRKEFLRQDARAGLLPDDVEVIGGRGGLDFNYEKLSLRASIGGRTSDVDTGGATGGLAASFRARPNLGLDLGLDSDFAFFTPQAVRNDVRMTGVNLSAWTQATSRLGLNFAYARTHFEGPDGGFRFASRPAAERPRFDHNRDMFSGAVRFEAGGFGTSKGNVRFDLGLRGLFFQFDRTLPEVGYWNPRRFRQAMASVAPTYRRGEKLVLTLHASGGVQSENDADWEPALYFYGEFLRQIGRRWDLWGRGDYSTSDIRRRAVGDGYRAWSVTGGFLVRLGDRRPEPQESAGPSRQVAAPEPRPAGK